MNVRIISRKRNVALVEWVETPDGTATYQRAVLPATELRAANGNMATHPEPGMGIPYGVAWEELLSEGALPEATAQTIANELRRTGIWTLADLQADPQTARAAFQKAYGMDVQRLQAAARQRHSGGKTT
jgi:hypothetical protein